MRRSSWPVVLRGTIWCLVVSFLLRAVGVAVAAEAAAGQPAAALVWDAERKEFNVKEGETNLLFSFSVTNVSSSEVTIRKVHPSCGCTLVKLPSQPWVLPPGAHDSMEVVLDLRGKSGMLVKNILVDSTAGFKTLLIKVMIPVPPMSPTATSSIVSRAQNIRQAMVDRQAVFKGDCARCHSAGAVGKTGQALYQAVCAVCHEAAHRASMVPDLRQPKAPRDTDYWRQWITSGKEGTLMPAFGKQADSGPLSDKQIRSLVEYLDRTFPKVPVATAPDSTGK